MKVSIIVPTRDRPALLARAVRSILAQDHADIEVVLVDDGSPEPARILARQLRAEHPQRIRLVELGAAGGQGSGPGQARNVGLEQAGGQLLGFCDDDDEWTDPHHLARAAACFAADSTLDLYIANQVGQLNGQQVIDDWLSGLVRPSTTPGAAATPIMVVKEAFCVASTFPHLNTVLLRRAVLTASGGFWTAVRYEEDRDFFWRALDRSQRVAVCFAPMAVHHVPDPARTVNASTQHIRRDKLLISAMVSRHIALEVSNRAIADLARTAESNVLKQLTQLSLDSGHHRAASRLGREALSLRFSWKWWAYCGWLNAAGLLKGAQR